jgi:hypothetical protein
VWRSGCTRRLTKGAASQVEGEEDDDDDEEEDDDDDEEGNPVRHECLCVRVYQWSMFICVRISRILFFRHSRPCPRADASSLLRHPEDLQSFVPCAQGARPGCPMGGETEHMDLLHASDCKVWLRSGGSVSLAWPVHAVPKIVLSPPQRVGMDFEDGAARRR